MTHFIYLSSYIVLHSIVLYGSRTESHYNISEEHTSKMSSLPLKILIKWAGSLFMTTLIWTACPLYLLSRPTAWAAEAPCLSCALRRPYMEENASIKYNDNFQESLDKTGYQGYFPTTETDPEMQNNWTPPTVIPLQEIHHQHARWAVDVTDCSVEFFSIQRRFGCRTTKCGLAGDIGAIEILLIDWRS